MFSYPSYPCAENASAVLRGLVLICDSEEQEDGLPSPPFCSPWFNSFNCSFIADIGSVCISSCLPSDICVTLMCQSFNPALCDRREDVFLRWISLVSSYSDIILRCQLLSFKYAFTLPFFFTFYVCPYCLSQRPSLLLCVLWSCWRICPTPCDPSLVLLLSCSTHQWRETCEVTK